MTSILIPAGFDSGYVCARSLSRRGCHTVVASEYDDALVTASRFCDETKSIPSPRDDLVAYKDALVRIAARPDVRTILPLRQQDPYLFTKYRHEFEPHVTLLTPSAETLGTVHDRLRLTEAASEAGVPAPETRPLDDVDEWDAEQIVKSRYNLLAEEYCPDYSPRELGIVKRVEYLESGHRPDVEALCAEMRHVPIVQEYVRSAGNYVVGALYDRGEALATFQHRQIRGDSYVGGGGVYRTAVDIPELDEVARTLLDHLEWHGLACIEYRKDAETGEFTFTEINPRLWQSLPCAVRAGADFPYYYWLAATGRPEAIDPRYDVGVGSHMLYGEAGYLLSVLRDESPFVERPSLARTAAEILSSCCTTPYFDVLHLDDPRPFVRWARIVLERQLRG